MVNYMEEKVKVAIEIPKKLYNNIIEKAKEAGFDSINDFILFVLEQLVSIETTSETVFTEEEEEKVKERLRALGYIE